MLALILALILGLILALILGLILGLILALMVLLILMLMLVVGLIGAQHPEIVFRILKIRLSQHPVARALCIASKNQILVQYLLRGSPDFYVGAVAVNHAA